ncbi:MAG: cohesin domain-containing protein [Hespellia sp.]|nr:cohesin domain-containing protein [Hespellia sp.]
MKILKKLGLSFVLLSVMFLSIAFVSFAADGTLQFSDPTTTVGSEVTVEVKMATGGAAIGDGNATLSYDASKLEFVSGTNATGGNGTINISASGTGAETELSYSIVFKALAEGTATVEVSDYTAYLYSDEKLNLTSGNSTVTIGAGDGTAAVAATTGSGGGNTTVTVNGTQYTIYEAFSDSSLLTGFTKTTVAYDGAERQCAKQDNGELYMFYLNDASNETHMALYDSKKETFSFTEQVILSDELYILLNDRGDGSDLPSQFLKTTVTINGNEFPAWQDTSDTDFYLMYATSSTGEESFYRYDKQENTYQRYKVPEESKDSTSLGGTLGKIQNVVSKYFVFVLIAVAALALIVLIIIITLSVKLHRRNRELDDLYDGDYELDSDKSNDAYYDEDDDYYDDEDDEYYDDEDDDYYDDEDDEYYDDEDDEYYDEDDEYYEDEYDEVIPKSKSGRNSKKSKDDYQVNFVDI